MRKTTLFLTLICLSACGDVRWVKAGGDAATLEQDQAACRSVAAERAARMGSLAPPSPAMDPRFGAAPGPSQMDIRMLERQAEERCMHDKGYILVPAEK